MMDFLGVGDDGQERKGGFHHHAGIPGALLANLDIVGDAIGTNIK
jgi:hypothetical protein